MTSSKITGILPNPQRKKQFDIYVDSELTLTLDEDTIIEAGLFVGKDFCEKDIKKIHETVQYTKAKNKAITYLSFGDLSEHTLMTKLIRQGFDREICRSVCDNMRELGYTDDERYAKNLAQYLANTKLYGIRRIKEELKIKGIDRQSIDLAIDGLDTDFDQNIQRIIEKKFAGSVTDKTIRALIRYGYSYDEISSVTAFMEDYNE